MPRLILTTVALLLAAAAAPALAADGWVLWIQGNDSPWDSVSTFETREECAGALHQQAQAVEKLGLKVTETPGASFSAADTDRAFKGQCLVANADPQATATK
ncbi:MAG TPA: hypothetical protein VFE48_12065 [Methylomirabilota bacterium]|nr:hypothetical protein [Methylomirabilota bacterium]